MFKPLAVDLLLLDKMKKLTEYKNQPSHSGLTVPPMKCFQRCITIWIEAKSSEEKGGEGGEHDSSTETRLLVERETNPLTDKHGPLMTPHKGN